MMLSIRSIPALYRLQEIKQRIDAGAFVFAEEFPDYRFVKNVAAAQERRTCDQVFDEFLLACDSQVAKKDLAFVTVRGSAKLLAQIWRPEIGPRIFDEIRYSELARSRTPTNGRKKSTTTRSASFVAPSTTATGTETVRRSTSNGCVVSQSRRRQRSFPSRSFDRLQVR